MRNIGLGQVLVLLLLCFLLFGDLARLKKKILSLGKVTMNFLSRSSDRKKGS